MRKLTRRSRPRRSTLHPGSAPRAPCVAAAADDGCGGGDDASVDEVPKSVVKGKSGAPAPAEDSKEPDDGGEAAPRSLQGQKLIFLSTVSSCAAGPGGRAACQPQLLASSVRVLVDVPKPPPPLPPPPDLPGPLEIALSRPIESQSDFDLCRGMGGKTRVKRSAPLQPPGLDCPLA